MLEKRNTREKDLKILNKLSKINNSKSKVENNNISQPYLSLCETKELSEFLQKAYDLPIAIFIDTDESFYLYEQNLGIIRAQISDIDKCACLQLIVFDSQKNIFKYTNSIYWDCLLAAKCLNENETEYSIQYLANKYKIKGDFIAEKIYNLYLFQKFHFSKDNLKGVFNVFKNIEMPCASILYKMTQNGISVDNEYLEKLISKYTNLVENNKNKFYARADELGLLNLNIDNAAQLSSIENNDETLHSFLTEYRHNNKILGSFLLKIKENLQENKIHCKFNQYGAKTGRLSSNSPNMQNMPKTDNVRNIFIAENGNTLISSDYSQHELRILAEMSKDKKLLELFKNDLDIYTQVAAIVFNAPYNDCGKYRDKIKTIFLGIIYGMGYSSLAEQLGCTEQEATEIKEKLLTLFPGIKKFEDETIQLLNKNKYVATLFGRKRRFEGSISNRECRQAINARIQGTGADIIKIALYKLGSSKVLKKLNTKLLLTIHDEILFECPKENVERASKEIKYIMETCVSAYLHVPMKCNIINYTRWSVK